MIIEDINGKKSANRNTISNRLKLVILFILFISIGLYLTLPVFSNSQATAYFTEHYNDTKLRYEEMGVTNFLPLMRRATTETILSNTHKYLTNQSIPHININVDFVSWQKIKADRNAMLGKAFMGSKKTYHKASIQYNGKNIPVKIRLKGGRLDHIDSPKRWSFRIKTRKGKALFGMKVFALQHPKTRGYHREAIFHKFAQKNEIISLNYFYVDVSINGETIGTMAVEEVPAKEMLERQERKEGLLYKFSDRYISPLYHETVSSRLKENPEEKYSIHKLPAESLYSGNYGNLFRIYYNAFNTPIQEISHKQDGEFYKQQRPIAVGLLKGLLEGHLDPSKVFDAQKMGAYFAYLALWGDSHSASFRNARYYFNPYTYRFEPIVNDSNAYSHDKIRLYPNRNDIRDHEINRLILQDPKVLNAYLKSVNDYSDDMINNVFFDRIRKIEEIPLSNLREEFWFLPEFELSSMRASIKAISDAIDSGSFFDLKEELINDINDPHPIIVPENFNAPAVVDANIIHKEQRTLLEIHNLFPLKAKVTALTIKINGRTSPLKNHLIQNLPITIDPFYYNQPLTYNTIELKNLKQNTKIDISGTIQLQTQKNKNYSFVTGKSFPTLTTHPLNSQTNGVITSRYPFIQYEPETQRFTITKGAWEISEFIIFPDNASLTISPGAHVLFTEKAGLMIKGSLQANGTLEQPIVLDSTDSNKKTWSGITVFQAQDISSLNHVQIKNTSAASNQGWELTAGVTFYKADVNINNTHFTHTNAEDALNIVHSKFNFTNSTIKNTRSDGFDADYASGLISNSVFSQIGGDAIDFSGSEIQVNNADFLNIHDKAISAGENTEIRLNDIHVINSGTGLAVKDGSLGKIQNATFEKIEYSTLMSYTKKPIYGAARLVANNVQFKNEAYALIAQKGNELSLDGEEIEPIKINIKKLYTKGYMKK